MTPVWAGKLIGAVAGLFSGGPFGLLVGLLAGHLFDKAISQQLPQRSASSREREQVQQIFFRATFRFMGRLAKADGRVSEQEISAASGVMEQMGLRGEQRQAAIRFFTEGKDPGSDLNSDLVQLRDLFAQRQDLAMMFLEIQLSVAYADGRMSMEERRLFDQLCRLLGIGAFQFEWINGRVQAALQSAGRQQQGRRVTNSDDRELRNAYAVLGVAPDASDDALKKAYRKLMSQHHPDKLVARGLPEQMMKLAKEKTQEIQTAYDRVRKARGR